MESKKFILVISLLFVMLALSSAFVLAEENSTLTNSTIQSCEDSDGGLSYYVFGEVRKSNNQGGTDCCTNGDAVCSGNSGNSVSEKYCTALGDIGYEIFSCSAGCYNGACNPVTIIKEQVKCIFDNSNDMQKCYTNDGKFGCSGTGTCVVDVSGQKGSKLVWKSSCSGSAYTVIDGNNEYAKFECAINPEPAIVDEQVKCVFVNSNEMQSCYAGEGKFMCSGTGTCVVDVSGEKGKKLSWLSTCEGEAYTVLDGNNEYAEFNCVPEINETIPVIVKEQVKCVFKNTATEQKCYTAEDNSRFSCSTNSKDATGTGTRTCVMDIKGKKGEKITWKSSCGGYAYTIIDGDNEYAEFDCVAEGNTTIETISGKGFRYAYWQCYNGDEEKQGSESSCKSSETWQIEAKKFCMNRCYKDGSKCGVNSFSVSGECYLDYTEESFISKVEIESNDTSIQTIEASLICKDSCPLDGKCYPFGYRKSGNFCSDTGSFAEQLEGDAKCDNNFECSSNVCVSGTCISEGLLQKIISWFKNLFS